MSEFGQAGVFREELEEEEYFWPVVLPPDFSAYVRPVMYSA